MIKKGAGMTKAGRNPFPISYLSQCEKVQRGCEAARWGPRAIQDNKEFRGGATSFYLRQPYKNSAKFQKITRDREGPAYNEVIRSAQLEKNPTTIFFSVLEVSKVWKCKGKIIFSHLHNCHMSSILKIMRLNNRYHEG